MTLTETRVRTFLSTSVLAAISPRERMFRRGEAHLYEALYLVNHGIDEAVRGVQRLKKCPKLFMETYHKSMAGLERRRAIINVQFMLEMRKLEEDDDARFSEEYNVWLSDEPLTNEEICGLMREVERQRKQEGKLPLVQFLTPQKRSRKSEKKNGTVHSSRKPNGAPPSASAARNTGPDHAHE